MTEFPIIDAIAIVPDSLNPETIVRRVKAQCTECGKWYFEDLLEDEQPWGECPRCVHALTEADQ